MGTTKKPHSSKIIFTESQQAFLRANWNRMTNQQLADALGVKITWLRMKKYELGLRRIEMEYWTEEQIDFLKANYQTKGDVEIAEIFQQLYPKNKKWRKHHIRKKRVYLCLNRTPAESKAIASADAKPGGNSYTIDKNSCSKNFHPSWVAQQIAWRDRTMQEELKKNETLIEAATTLYQLKRKIKAIKKSAIR